MIKHNGHLRTWGKCRKHEPQTSVFYTSQVFSNDRSVLSQCNTRRVCVLLRDTNTAAIKYTCNRNICHWVLLLKRKIIALEHIERNVSSIASTVQLAKTLVITHLLTYGSQFSCHATEKLGNSNTLYYNKKDPVELKHCETSSFYRVFYVIKTKTLER